MLSSPRLVENLHRQIREGRYQDAFLEAKRLSLERLKEGRREEAAEALGAAAHALCLLNHPAKAKSFAREAQDLARSTGNSVVLGYALAVGALAHLRLAEFDAAEAQIDRALEILNPHPDREGSAFARLVSAELSMSREDYAEARVFAEEAYAAGSRISSPWIRARACLVKGICLDRIGESGPALEILRTAARELEEGADAETSWLVQAALAGALRKAGREEEGAAWRRAAVETIRRLADPLPEEARDRFLRNPAVVSAMGGDPQSGSDLWKVPVQVPAEPPPPALGTGLRDLKPVLDVLRKINTEHNLRRLVATILDTMIDFCNARRGTLVVFEGEKFKVELSRDRSRRDLRLPERGVCRTVLRLVRDTGRRVVTGNARRDPALCPPDRPQDRDLLSLLCLPLRLRNRLVGAVYLDNPDVEGAFGAPQIELAEILTDHAAVAIDNALLYSRSIRDGLTGLLNHGHFEKRLEYEVARARRHGRPLGLLMLDVDDFKKVNDTLGHDAGNETLKNLGRILSSTMREADLVARIRERDAGPVVARYGGDEFEILLPETPREGVRRAGERLLGAIHKERLMYRKTPVPLAVSIGGAVFPDDAKEPRELLLKADEALYAAKRAGKNRFVLFPSDAAAGGGPPEAPPSRGPSARL